MFYLLVDMDALSLSKVFAQLSYTCVHPYIGKFPCGDCFNCRSRRADKWVSRMMREYENSDSALVITLTQNNKLLKMNSIEVDGRKYPAVQVRTLQTFMKRLRKRLSDRDITVRYVAKGEYGDFLCRPHYHVSLFFRYNCPVDGFDYVDYIKTSILKAWHNGVYKIYGNKVIDWTHPYNRGKNLHGDNSIVEFDDATIDSFKYCCKYVSSELISAVSVPSRYSREFMTFSRGIGLNFTESFLQEIRDKIFKFYVYNGYRDFCFSDIDKLESVLSYSIDDKVLRIDNVFIRPLCGGYYKYHPYDTSDRVLRDYVRLTKCNKEWIDCKDKPFKGYWTRQELYDYVKYLTSELNRLKLYDFGRSLGLDYPYDNAVNDDIVVYADDSRYRLLNGLYIQYRDVNLRKDKNRYDGCRSVLYKKFMKRQGYITSVLSKDEVDEIRKVFTVDSYDSFYRRYKSGLLSPSAIEFDRYAKKVDESLLSVGELCAMIESFKSNKIKLKLK